MGSSGSKCDEYELIFCPHGCTPEHPVYKRTRQQQAQYHYQPSQVQPHYTC